MSNLTIATPTEQRDRDHATFAAWGAGLTPEQFLEREQRLRGHDWAARTLTTWLWRDETGATLSSCETFLDEAQAGTRTGTAALIASVFTEPRLRAHGHAANMLRAVIERLRADASCLAVTLFSEIGTNFYARLGFWPVPAFDTFFPARADAPSVEWLHAPLPAPRHSPGDEHTLRLTLSAPRLDWHLERERLYTSALERTPLERHGARVDGSTITWTAYWKTNELQVLSLDAHDPRHLAPLLHAASHAAHLAGLPTVRVWETSALTALPGARRVERTDEVAMFLPLLPGVQAWTMVERGLWA
ncbi:MAG: hypothetical protein Q8L48_42625 [Archangium sp.]|nr:hypothetical protein [Archangium sp.]